MEKLNPLPIALFFLYLLVGLLIIPDYGVSTDEIVQVQHAEVQLDYAAKKLGIEDYEPYRPDHELETYNWRHYSMMYGMAATFIAEFLGYEKGDLRLAFQVRHYLVFLLFWLACLAFYRTLKGRFGGWQLPLLGTAILVLTPRIFANSFYNPKDLVVLAFYVYGTASLAWFLRSRSWASLLVHALATGAVLNTRLPSMFLPLMTLFMLVLQLIQEQKNWGKTLAQMTVYSGLSLLIFIALFPLLWEDPMSRIVEVWGSMSKFDWGSSNLIFNEWIPGDETPPWYIPAWMAITIPLAVLGLIVAGILLLVKRQALLLWSHKKFWQDGNERLDLAQLGLGVGPILAVIVLGSNLYNGWRHLYFVYPALVYLAVVAWQYVSNHSKGKWRKVFQALLYGNLAWMLAFIMIVHPHQQVYFNALAGDNLTKRFDMDYWGLSFYSALKEIARRTPDGEVARVVGNTRNCWYNVLYLPEEERAKIKYDFGDDYNGYYLSNFRRPEAHRQFIDQEPPHDAPYFIIDVLGEPIMGVFHKPAGGKPDASVDYGGEG
ncbi:hypothetical protein CEQ90_02345 [Lewinellaceae bacterium SD302]|nr:hypothetical protein CEQ90_02345 [Lewinellaceae bacterium SD302]